MRSDTALNMPDFGQDCLSMDIYRPGELHRFLEIAKSTLLMGSPEGNATDDIID